MSIWLTLSPASCTGSMPKCPPPICSCWTLVDVSRRSAATESDLRLLRRPIPPFQQLCLAGSDAVTDEWLETLAVRNGNTTDIRTNSKTTVKLRCVCARVPFVYKPSVN